MKERTMAPFHRYIQCGAGYLFYFGANALFLFFLLPLSLLALAAPPVRKRLIRFSFSSYVVLLTRYVLPMLGVYRFAEISGLENTRICPSPIFVANHRSRIDGPVLLALLPRVGTIMKSSYARMPVFSSFVKNTDFVAVDSRSVSTIASAIDRCRELLTRGRGILIFPEGSRARSGRLLPFRDLAFKLSKETGHPVVPTIVHSDGAFMAKRPGSIFPAQVLRFTVRFLKPHTPGENESIADFNDRVHRTMVREIATLDEGTEWQK